MIRRPPLLARAAAILIAATLVALAATSLAVAAPADPSGTWRTEDGRARVRVETCGPAGDRLCGFIVWLQDAGRDGKGGADRNNPDPAKAGRPLLGHQIMLGLSPNRDSRYEGRIYNAEDGKAYDVTVWLAGPGDLKVKGCLLFFCKTESWTRAAGTEAGQLTGPTGGSGGPRPDPEWAAAPARRGPGRKS